MTEYNRVAAVVDLDAIYENLNELKSHIRPGTRVCAVIKTDAYGHGAVPVAKWIRKLADFFAVATVEEGMELRKNGIWEPILILGHTPASLYREAIELGLRMNVYELSQAEAISNIAVSLGKTAYLHMKLETGMNRLGFSPDEESLQAAETMSRLPGVCLEGLFSHLARADEADKTDAYRQFNIFQKFDAALRARGVKIPIRHIGNSAAMIDLPEFSYDMMRAGIALYGMYPSEDVSMDQVVLKPALRLVSRVIFVKTIEVGESVGYGGTFTAKRKTTIATIGIGYGDGYPRKLSGKADVLLHGKRAPICGRVCMDQFMVDVTDIPDVKEEDEAVLIGWDGNEVITVEELSALADTFNYEFVCDLGKRIPRIYISGGNVVEKKDYFEDFYKTDLP